MREALAANEGLVAELRAALAGVETFKALLPLRAWCGKVRTDDGYWEMLDADVTEHRGIQFSHGMCPRAAPDTSRTRSRETGPSARRAASLARSRSPAGHWAGLARAMPMGGGTPSG